MTPYAGRLGSVIGFTTTPLVLLMRHLLLIAGIAASTAGSGDSAHAASIDTVPVGNPNNAPEVYWFGQLGSVAYPYRIGKYEVTNAQYVEFLNAVDPTGGNSLALYNPGMSDIDEGGILRTSGALAGSKYEIRPGRANNPVIYVNWYDAVRFANWLHNGQGTGDTESGAYTLLGGTPTPTNANSVSRNPDATWFLPSENEWYKAAYHKNDGITGNYWDFAFAFDVGNADGPYSDQPPGVHAPTQSRTGNFYYWDQIDNGYDGGFAVTGMPFDEPGQNYLTDVGAYALSSSPYGTFDQAGNVYEWNDTLIIDDEGIKRGFRGSSWAQVGGDYAHTLNRAELPFFERLDIGFRVASAIPEASSLAMVVIAATCVQLTQIATASAKHKTSIANA